MKRLYRLYRWWWPDGFVGDDPTSKRNARWLGWMLAIAILIMLTLSLPAWAGTRVWALYGWGDNAFGSSSGINDIAAQAARVPGVVSVRVYNYWQTQQVGNEMMAAPSTDKMVVVGYSCGANSATTIAYGMQGHRTVYPLGIQESLWCGGYALGTNVPYAQETYAGCLLTLGFGCKQYAAGQGFKGHIVLIKRPDLHPLADTDPDAQRDVLSAIATIANPSLSRAHAARLAHTPRVKVVTRYHGQRP